MSSNTPVDTLSRRPAELMLLLETMLGLLVARVVVSAFPFHAAVSFYRLRRGPAVSAISPAQQARAAHIGLAVRAVSARLPWTSTCLMQSLAGAVLLRRRGVSSTIHLGAARAKESVNFEAHAWLTCGDQILTGADQAPRYVSVGAFTAGR